jgi:hypothetical protein
MGQFVLPIIAAIGTAASVAAAYKGQKAQEEAAKAQKKQQRLAARQSQLAAIREAQLRRAQALNAATSVGSEQGSGLAGGIGGIGSQLGSGLGYSTQMSAISGVISKAADNASKYSGLSSLFGTVGAYAQGMHQYKVQNGLYPPKEES